MQRSKMDKTNEMNETNDTEEPEPLLKNERIMPVAAKVSSGARNRTRCPCVNAPAAWRAAMRQVMDVRGGGGRQRGGRGRMGRSGRARVWVSASRAGVSSNVLLYGRGRCRERDAGGPKKEK